MPEIKTDRRRRRSRGALMRAAEALFAEHGVDAVTIDDIVGAADVAKGTFYNHFPDKEALIEAVAGEIREGLEDCIAAVNAEVPDPARRVARAVALYLQLETEDPVRAKALRRLPPGALDPSAPLNAGVRRDVRAGVVAGRFAPVPIVVGVAGILGVTFGAGALVQTRGAAATPRRMAEDLIAFLLRGLGLNAVESADIARSETADMFSQPRFRC